MHWELEDNYKCKEKFSGKQIYKDILSTPALFQLLVCTSQQLQTYDLSINLDKIAVGKIRPRKNLTALIEDNLNTLILNS